MVDPRAMQLMGQDVRELMQHNVLDIGSVPMPERDPASAKGPSGVAFAPAQFGLLDPEFLAQDSQHLFYLLFGH